MKNIMLKIKGIAKKIRDFLCGRLSRRIVIASNALNPGTHEGATTLTLAAAFTSRHLLAKVGSSADTLEVCAASDLPVGTVDDTGESGDRVNLQFLGASASSRLVVASESISQGARVYTAASGKVQNEPTAAGTCYLIGTALQSASVDGDLLEIDPIAPIKVTTVAAATGVAADDVAALYTALEGGPLLLKALSV